MTACQTPQGAHKVETVGTQFRFFLARFDSDLWRPAKHHAAERAVLGSLGDYHFIALI